MYRQVIRRETGICKKNFYFSIFLTSSIKKRTFGGIKNSGRLSKLTFMCTECDFEAGILSNKTKILMNFLGCEPQFVRVYRKLLTRLSETHSSCTVDHFEENENSLEKIIFHLSRIERPNIFDCRQSFLCFVLKSAFCVSKGPFWYVFWSFL